MGLLASGVLGHELSDLVGLLADDHVLGHDPAGEAAVDDRVQDACDGSLAAHVEVQGHC